LREKPFGVSASGCGFAGVSLFANTGLEVAGGSAVCSSGTREGSGPTGSVAAVMIETGFGGELKYAISGGTGAGRSDGGIKSAARAFAIPRNVPNAPRTITAISSTQTIGEGPLRCVAAGAIEGVAIRAVVGALTALCAFAVRTGAAAAAEFCGSDPFSACSSCAIDWNRFAGSFNRHFKIVRSM
jgi:hypothetical protein